MSINQDSNNLITTREQAKSQLEKIINSSESSTNVTEEPSIYYTNAQGWQPEIVLTLAFGILIFVIISLSLCTFILIKQKAKTYYTLRIFGIITILGLSTFLVIIGYSIEQINGVIALFGAVAGYLLGRSDTSSQKGEESTSSFRNSPPLE
ncbi:hypothetical protein [Acinetobacter variabilis]|uniref:hypothetical protein n=1 Tax=Acinetobacter variabilis TaxID=70346 RepID=UPI002897585A|nr:hypothetical protein [Acinetobacter variabilis]